jgi:predicted nucleic acid-binding protein
MQTGQYLIDTDVLIEYLCGSPQAGKTLEDLSGPLYLCAISVAELYAGVKGKREEQALEAFLQAFVILPVDERLARQAGRLRQQYYPSHGTGLADALIAAAAQEAGATLLTFNLRHYPMLSDARVPYAREG